MGMKAIGPFENNQVAGAISMAVDAWANRRFIEWLEHMGKEVDNPVDNAMAALYQHTGCCLGDPTGRTGCKAVRREAE